MTFRQGSGRPIHRGAAESAEENAENTKTRTVLAKVVAGRSGVLRARRNTANVGGAYRVWGGLFTAEPPRKTNWLQMNDDERRWKNSSFLRVSASPR